MQIAIRPFLLAGIAFTGAAAVALTPIKPNLPDIQMPAINTPALELAAVPSYLEWVQQTTEADTKNVPSWQQILDPDFDGALSAAIELGSYLFQHFLPADLVINNAESITTQTPLPTSPPEFINSVEAMLTDPAFLPTIMNDIAQVVQVVATNAVEPVIDLVLRMTFTTLYRASNLVKATFQGVPDIAFSVVAAGVRLLQSVNNSALTIISAALRDPVTILAAATDAVLEFGRILADETINVIDRIDSFRRDIEAALVSIPPSPEIPEPEPAPASVVPVAGLATLGPAAALGPTGSTTSPTPEDAQATDSAATDSAAATPSDAGLSEAAPSDDSVKTGVGSSKVGGLRTSAGDVPATNPTPTPGAGTGSADGPTRTSATAPKSPEGSAGDKSGAKSGAKHRSANR